jgi:hypothetical protein
MPAEDDLTAIVEIERLINEAARTQPGSEQVRLSKALGDAIGKSIRRQPQQHTASEEALNNARANVGLVNPWWQESLMAAHKQLHLFEAKSADTGISGLPGEGSPRRR